MGTGRYVLFVATLAEFSCRAAPSTAPGGGTTETAFVDVTVIPMDSERVLEHQTVVVRDNQITAMGNTLTTQPPAGALVVDGRGKTLIPGLTDMHTHVVRPEDLRLYIARGVTTVRNMWGTPQVLDWRAEIKAGRMVGPTIFTAGPILDGDNPVHDGSLVLRTPDEVDAAVRLHQRLGYDFLKVYSKLSQPVYSKLMAAAKAAHLTVAGHIPRAVRLEDAIAAGQRSIEHMHGLIDAIQRADSPVRDLFDGPSRAMKIDYVDETKIPTLVGSMVSAGTWNCPTRTVMDAWDDAAAVRTHLLRPEMKYVPVATRTIWQPAKDDKKDPAATAKITLEVARDRHTVQVYEKTILALHKAGGHLLVGTDPVNPLVVAGYSVHDELAHFVRIGLTPHAALRIATHDAAMFVRDSAMGDASFGTIEVGKRADLLLLDDNPLKDIRATTKIAGVMTRGRWHAKEALNVILSEVAATVDGRTTAFVGLPALTVWNPEFEVSWNDAYFGSERIQVGRDDGGRRMLQAQTFDPHRSQRMSLNLVDGVLKNGRWLAGTMTLISDGAAGSGNLEVLRTASTIKTSALLLSGMTITREELMATDAALAVQGFIAPKVLLGLRMKSLVVGESLKVYEREMSLGSVVRWNDQELQATRTADVTRATAAGASLTRRFEIQPAKGPLAVLHTDVAGWLLEMEIRSHGGVVRFKKI